MDASVIPDGLSPNSGCGFKSVDSDKAFPLAKHCRNNGTPGVVATVVCVLLHPVRSYDGSGGRGGCGGGGGGSGGGGGGGDGGGSRSSGGGCGRGW